ncbi:MAG: 2-(3-amino-3-carboxypropyl)histidine synthase [Methanosaeta sp. PtaU1.Bin028]|nr:MAG: 2-(3-amino-3-carboxypropyl)histidine synthase [Methanosaeta sp. PtaU1.Bin028]
MPDRVLSIAGYEIDLGPALYLISSSRIAMVGLQVPEGLKRAAPLIARTVSDLTGSRVIISGDPCFGACDLDLDLLTSVDLLLHVGHSELCAAYTDKVVYIEARMSQPVADAVQRSIPLLTSPRVGLCTTVQHAQFVPDALMILAEAGIQAEAALPGARGKYRGQVLGCNYQAARDLDVDEYLFIGSGLFHPLGMAISTGKRVVCADPTTGQACEVLPEALIRRRFGAIAKAMDSRRIAVLVSKKPGQQRQELADFMMEIGTAAGREMIMVRIDNIEPDRLINLGIDAAVSTACPRVALDDSARYPIPILTPPEFEILLGRKEDYEFDEIV